MPGTENRLWCSVTSKISDIYRGVLTLVLPRTTLLSVWPSKSHSAILALCPFSLLGTLRIAALFWNSYSLALLFHPRFLGCEECWCGSFLSWFLLKMGALQTGALRHPEGAVFCVAGGRRQSLVSAPPFASDLAPANYLCYSVFQVPWLLIYLNCSKL